MQTVVSQHTPSWATCVLGIVMLFIGVVQVMYDMPAFALVSGWASGVWFAFAVEDRGKGR